MVQTLYDFQILEAEQNRAIKRGDWKRVKRLDSTLDRVYDALQREARKR